MIINSKMRSRIKFVIEGEFERTVRLTPEKAGMYLKKYMKKRGLRFKKHAKAMTKGTRIIWTRNLHNLWESVSVHIHVENSMNNRNNKLDDYFYGDTNLFSMGYLDQLWNTIFTTADLPVE